MYDRLKSIVPVFLALTLAGCMFSLPDNTGAPARQPEESSASLAEHLEGTILIRLAEGTMPDEAADAVGGLVGSVRGSMARIVLPKGADISANIDLLQARDEVVYAEPVYLYHLPVSGVARKYQTETADYRANQWGPSAIWADSAWEEADASSVRVAVVDTGIDSGNPEFGGRVLGGQNFITGDDPKNYEDNQGHGTFVAGIIGARHDDGSGIAGIAGTVKLLSVKVLNEDGTGCSDDIAEGMRWAADPERGDADVVNLSMNGLGYSQALQEAVDYALNEGVIVVAALGNGIKYGTCSYPAGCEGAIAVAAVKSDGTKADFSSEAPYVSVAAPGVDIFSAIWTRDFPHSFAYWSGTSLAAPHVAGAVALLLASRGGPPTRIRSVLEESAGSSWSKALGYGLINVQAALDGYDSHPDLYGLLEVTVSELGDPVANAEVSVQSGGKKIASNLANEEGMAYFHYLREGSYEVDVASGAMHDDASVNIVAGELSEIAVAL